MSNGNWMDTTGFCLQRRRRQLFNVPPPRLDNLATSPYLHFTQAQLDMRRKAEILKYSAVSTNSKTNDLTKAEKYAQMARLARGNGSFNRISKIQETCPQDETIKTPNYFCDVPGPYTLLYLDETVELYNYGRGNTTVAIENPPQIVYPYKDFIYENVASLDNLALQNIADVYDKSIPVATINMFSNINSQFFNYTIPISFYYANVIGLSSPQAVHITVQSVYYYLFYNKTLISTNDDTVQYAPVSGITAPTINTNNLTKNFTVTPSITRDLNVSSPFLFQENLHLGSVQIQDLEICKQSNVIYDLRITVIYTTIPDNIIQYITVVNPQ